MSKKVMKKSLMFSLITLAILGAGSVGYLVGKQQTSHSPPTAESERPVLYWYDPMVPDKRFDKPGKSPFMDMELVPRYADDVQEDGGVTVSARQQQNLGVRTARAEMREIADRTTGYGTVTLNERGLRTLVAPSGGIVEKLTVNALQQQVKKGETLAMLWNPTWAAAQHEYLAVRQLGDEGLTHSARQRLALIFMPEAIIRQVERSGKPQDRIAITAPEDGYVNKLEVRQGMQLSPAQPLFEIASLNPVWIDVDYPEAQAAQLTIGSDISATSNAWPGKIFHGKISELLPVLDSTTRTLKARVILDNPQQQLKPGMYLTVQLSHAQAQPRLAIPQEALLVSGSQNRVLLSDGNGHFTPRHVTAGASLGDWVEIINGLKEGDSVVTSGQFLIDSEASLRSALPQFDTEASATPATPVGYQTQGVIKARNGNQITIEHEAVPALNWSPMTMDFTLPSSGLPQGVEIGNTVNFQFTMDDSGIHILHFLPANNPHAEHGGHP
ncbi:efflux RND transporter periplasmic adaptor subunit [Pectobacterium wasabiae]|uniref:Cobalt transporter n=1 Tax=Pectobacterium wasabiae TaxID=55208 RepID=A0AAW3EJ94_9GAMM|nr:efflux RND transporter periplasmic adaptor subunit [Pectobacterium wasabiae]AOR64622.1 efflux transporter periplasmic adaptor subunit [Pectobacterium wasabiae CFBP 3304]EJS93381.1 Putative Cation efflux system protein cusB [Pectobacterium wasabiae CFBP 3304]KFX08886.1 cobalt transporter [Pectobacterium wasabiae]KGA28993.1 cobalt transporter [Pectobacterium wasabiae]